MAKVTKMRRFPSNNDRASWANSAVSAFVNEVGDSGDEGSNIADLLCDLRHLCDAQGLSFDDLVSKSEYHYLTEIGTLAPDPGTDPQGKADPDALDGNYGEPR